MSSSLKIIEDKNFLSQISEPVTDFTAANREFIVDMVQLMKNKKGIGLAAIQVGVPLRIFVMETREEGTLAIINPEILEKEKKIKRKEGCLSFPNLIVQRTRHKRIKVKYYTKEGDLVERKFTGIEARIFQHEFDHLNGITIGTK